MVKRAIVYREVSMEIPDRIIVATRNRHKAMEFGQIFGSSVQILAAQDVDQQLRWEETGQSFEDNSLIKARCVAKAAEAKFPNAWIIADDSGLCVKALAGAPGIFSSRYGGEEGNDLLNNKRLLAELINISDRSASFKCCLILHRPGYPDVCFHGSLDGRILDEARGANGFGYDPLFIPDGYSVTLAELPVEIKNRISHRAKASLALMDWIESN